MRRSDLRHAIKMLRDTPHGLRHAVPSPLSILRKVLLRNLVPRFIRHPRKFLIASMPPGCESSNASSSRAPEHCRKNEEGRRETGPLSPNHRGTAGAVVRPLSGKP
jgi:hypothetical protein